MSRRTTKARDRQRERLLRANVWSIRTLWHGMLRNTYRLVVLLLVLAALGGAGWGGKLALDRLFYNNPDFRLQTVKLNTNEAIDERDFIAITGIELDTNIFRIDVKAIKRRLLEQPAIRAASVERQTPGTLIVNVTARVPVAWLACPDAGCAAERAAGAMVLGNDGIVYPCPKLQLATAEPLPVITLSGKDGNPFRPGEKLVHPELANCVRLANTARDFGGFEPGWIDCVRQTNAWSLALTTKDGLVATFGLGDHARQLSYLRDALAHAGRKGYALATINLIPRENVPVTLSSSAPPRAVPVDEPEAAPARPNRRARDLDALLNRN